MDAFTVDQCRSCGVDVIWAVTGNAKSMPVDAAPSPKGNIQLERRDGLPPLARVLTTAQQFGKTGLRTSHFVTCKDAAKWRHKPASRGGRVAS